jgi:hypothetical protein
MAFGKLRCMLCGKEKLDPEAHPSQEFYLCLDCSTFWLTDHLRRNCAYLAEGASKEPTRRRYRRMEAAWRALADEQDWLDGEASPDRKSEQ